VVTRRDLSAADLRAQILAATQRVIEERGVASATTRAIAEEAHCAEGSIYRYFADKHELFHAASGASFPEFMELAHTLPNRAGTRTVEENLQEVALASLRFYRAVRPLMVGALADRDLLEEHRLHFGETKGGPIKAIGGLSTYLRREQRLGRISDRTSAEHAARLLLGACLSNSIMEQLMGVVPGHGTDERFAREVVHTLMEGLTARS